MRRRGRGWPAGRTPIVAALDIGSHNVSCLIGLSGDAEKQPARRDENGLAPRLRVIGIGHHRSQGVAAGAVIDLEQASAAVAAAVLQAERAAGLRIERVHLGIDCAGLRSRCFDGYVEVASGAVQSEDIARLDAGARDYANRDGAALLGLNRLGFRLDGIAAPREPIGLAGRRLDASFHAVMGKPGPVRNLCLAAEACQLEIEGLVPAAFASALAATTVAERQAGVVSADIGAETTSIAAFIDGSNVLCATLAIGGQQMTDDIARTIGIPLAEAERIKTLYATVTPGVYHGHELVHPGGQRSGAWSEPITRAEIADIAIRGVHRILAGVHACIEGSGIERIRHSAIVMTGGGSEILGLEDLSFAAFGRPVRTAASPNLDGTSGRHTGGASSPAFACVVGIAMSAVGPSPWLPSHGTDAAARPGYLGRVERWLRESF